MRTDAQNISSQIDQSAGHPLREQIFLDLVGNVTFGSSPKIQLHAFFFKTETAAGKGDILIIYKRKGRLDILRLWQAVFRRSKVP